MIDNNIMDDNTTPVQNPPAGLPKIPVVPFSAWTWISPVIPQFYWNVYSAEQRIKEICLAIGRIDAYLEYLANKVNENNVKLADAINKVYKELTERLDALEKRLDEEVARIDALIADLKEKLEQEIEDRKNADTELHNEISQETQDRIHGDDTLHDEISTETTNRVHADDVLHTEISNETAAREHADNDLDARLRTEISDRTLADKNLQDQINEHTVRIDDLNTGLTEETSERMEDIANLQTQVNTRLQRTDIKGSEHITITPGTGNELTIGTDLDVDLDELHNEDSAINARIDAEIDERRNDDNELWDAVHKRIEMGKILAGDNVTVVNDPDNSTVTISATGGGSGEPTGTVTVQAGPGTTVEESTGETENDKVYTITPNIGDGIFVNDNNDISMNFTDIGKTQLYKNNHLEISLNNFGHTAIGYAPSAYGYEPALYYDNRVFTITTGLKGHNPNGNTSINSVAKNCGLTIYTNDSTAMTKTDDGYLDVVKATEDKAGVITTTEVREIAAEAAGGVKAVNAGDAIVVEETDDGVTVSGKPVDPENPNEYGVVRYSDLGDTNIIAPNRTTNEPASAENNGLAIGSQATSHGGLIIGNSANESNSDGGDNTVIGMSATTSATSSTIVGNGCSSSSNNATIVGNAGVVNANSDYSVAVGGGDVGNASPNSIVIGNRQVGENSEGTIVIGNGTTAVSTDTPNATVIGMDAYAHDDCVAIGHGSDARRVVGGPAVFAVGSEDLPRQIQHVADGTHDDDAATVRQLNAQIAALEARIAALEG